MRVFVVNEPLRWSPEDNDWVKAINLRPARAFGELVHLLPAGQLPDNPAAVVSALQKGLSGFTAHDCLLLTGDPRAIAWAAAIAAKRTGGKLNLLHWQRDLRSYDLIEVDLFPNLVLNT